MEEQGHSAPRRSDKAKAADGRVSLPQSARIAGMAQTTLHSWVSSGFIVPTDSGNERPGTGNHRRFDLRDLTSICAAAELRRQGVRVQDMRKIQERLREFGKDFASARLAIVRDDEQGVSDVVLIDGDRARKHLIVSVHDNPGQSIIAEIPLAPVARAARTRFKKALKETPAIRGRKPGKGAKRAQPSQDKEPALTG